MHIILGIMVIVCIFAFIAIITYLIHSSHIKKLRESVENYEFRVEEVKKGNTTYYYPQAKLIGHKEEWTCITENLSLYHPVGFCERSKNSRYERGFYYSHDAEKIIRRYVDKRREAEAPLISKTKYIKII